MADGRLWMIVPCARCGGTGEVDLDPDITDQCDDCEGLGDESRPPTPADLLSDPRVRLVVEALREMVTLPQRGRAREEAIRALAPFDEVDRG